MKRFFTRAFKKEKDALYHWTNDFFASLTILSIISLVLETVPRFAEYAPLFTTVEWVAVGFFTIEYVGRLWASAPHHKYAFSFFGVIDMVAILPTFFGLGNFTFLKSARALRIIRMLRMLRLAKVSRSGRATDESTSVLSLNIIIYFSVLLFALLIMGSLMYLVEPTTPSFESIPAGMWWSLKVFLGSVVVTEPVTFIGELLYVLTRFVGLLLLGLLVGVVGNVFRTLLMGGAK